MRNIYLLVGIAAVVTACGSPLVVADDESGDVAASQSTSTAPASTTTDTAQSDSTGGSTMPSDEDGSETTQPPTSTKPSEDDMPATSAPVIGEVPEALLQEVLVDAAERTGLSTSAFAVVRAQAFAWPDGSLGCPEPGQVYPQVITPGYHVELEVADGARYDYRLTERGSFKLCEASTITPPDK